MNVQEKFGYLLIPAVLILMAASVFTGATPSYAREVTYSGGEEVVWVTPGEPTQVNFPGTIKGGFKRKRSSLNLDKQDSSLIVFAQPDLSVDGEAILVHLQDRRSYAFRIMPAHDQQPRDEFIEVNDVREHEYDEEGTPQDYQQPTEFAPPTVVSGLVREMILVAELGKKKGIMGYRRSNRYTGETILHDGALEAKIDEIYMGQNLWGYVISVENLLETTQKLNPATFRLDGTRAIAAEKWELAPRPGTAEQMISKGHRGKVYIVTRAMNR